MTLKLQTVLLVLVIAVAAAISSLQITRAIDTLIAAQAAPVTIANPVTAVEVVNPVTAVEVTNPVTAMEIVNQVETISPRNAEIYGYCGKVPGRGYDLRIIGFAGGLEKEIAQGIYVGSAAELLARDVAEYYSLPELDFGDSSEECGNLDGWG